MKNKQRTTNNEQRTYRAFTIIELVVAIALLAMVISFAGLVFSVSIGSYRTAGANAEIMQKLRAITDQLNADFKGIRTDAPLLIWFEQDTNDHRQRYDQIMFFADGDFQSTQLYSNGSNAVPDPEGDKLVIGNVARIYYGQAQPDPNLLARRQHILTADSGLDMWPDPNDPAMRDFDDGSSPDDRDKYNELYEHDRLSLAQWKTIDGGNYDDVIDTCFGTRPLIDVRDPNTFHKLMCEGVGSFTIQWAYWDSGDKRFYWFPSDDPDGDGSDSDSHFDFGKNQFGFYFNIPGTINNGDWYYYGSFYPDAIKFTFRLFDSKGIIKEDGRAGRTFTHIVYLGE